MKSLFANVLLSIASGLIGVLLLELGMRAALGLPVLAIQDWRSYLADKAGWIEDDQLGWTMRPNARVPGKNPINTIDLGIRRNHLGGEEDIEHGAILVVGDSFAAGSEVKDDQSWPAHLERILGERVLNAGVGGYGVDQIVMRAEHLIPLVRPQTVIVGALVPDDVHRAGYMSYGRPKPYFVAKDGTYARMNDPIPQPADGTEPRLTLVGVMRLGLAHLYVIHTIMSRLHPDWWYSSAGEPGSSKLGQEFKRAPNNPLLISCYMLDRLSDTLDARNIRGMLVIQHGGWIFARNEKRSYEANELTKCAKRLGYDIVDEYDALQHIANKSIEDLQRQYVMRERNSVYGHMSNEGNALIAKLISGRLQGPPSGRIETEADKTPPGDGINLIEDEVFSFLANATNSVTSERGPVPDSAIQQLTATVDDGEHYGVIRWSGGRAGDYTFSLYVHSDSHDELRFQIIDDKQNGGIADYQMRNEIFNFTRVGAGENMNFTAERVDDHWRRVSFSVGLQSSTGVIIIQLADDDGATAFGDADVSMKMQAPMIERGGTSSNWCGPRRCTAATARP